MVYFRSFLPPLLEAPILSKTARKQVRKTAARKRPTPVGGRGRKGRSRPARLRGARVRRRGRRNRTAAGPGRRAGARRPRPPPRGTRQAIKAQAGPLKVGGARRRRPEATQSPRSQGRQEGAGAEKLEIRLPPIHARGSPVAAQAADRARQGAGLPDLRRGQRSPAVRDRRSGADRRHRQHDQRHGHPGVREGTGCRVAALRRAGPRRRRSGSRKPPRRSPRSTPSSAARPTRCACTCARWARSSCSRAKARSASRSASRKASTPCARALVLPADLRHICSTYEPVKPARAA